MTFRAAPPAEPGAAEGPARASLATVRASAPSRHEGATVTVELPRPVGGLPEPLRARLLRSLWLTGPLGPFDALEFAEPAPAPSSLPASFAEWLAGTKQFESVRYDVVFNEGGVLSVRFTEETMGAYPDTLRPALSVSTRTGAALGPGDLFTPAGAAAVGQLVRRKFEGRARGVAARAPAARSYVKEALAAPAAVPNDFAVTRTGVTFFQSIGLPHVVQSLEPPDAYPFTFAELAPHLRPDGPLPPRAAR